MNPMQAAVSRRAQFQFWLSASDLAPRLEPADWLMDTRSAARVGTGILSRSEPPKDSVDGERGAAQICAVRDGKARRHRTPSEGPDKHLNGVSERRTPGTAGFRLRFRRLEIGLRSQRNRSTYRMTGHSGSLWHASLFIGLAVPASRGCSCRQFGREDASLPGASDCRAVRTEIGRRLARSLCGASWRACAGRLAGSRSLARDARSIAAKACRMLWSVAPHRSAPDIPGR